MLGTAFVFSSLVSQLFETKNSGLPCTSAIRWLCSSTSRTVIPSRRRSSLRLLPGFDQSAIRIDAQACAGLYMVLGQIQTDTVNRRGNYRNRFCFACEADGRKSGRE